METRIGLLTVLLVAVTMVTYTDAKSKHKKPSGDKSLLTLNFMGDGSLTNKSHDRKSGQKALQSKSSHGAKSHDDKSKDISKSADSKSAGDDKKKVAKANIPSMDKSQKAVARGSIIDDISKIDDVPSLYRQGEKTEAFNNEDNTIDKVKQIDDGELTDYFHALNGENVKQSKTAHYHDDDLRHDEEDLRHYDENRRNDEDHKEITDEENQKYKDAGPGYEVFSDNPDESDTDDFYDDISQGKKPEMKMKKVRPTKSHFGTKDDYESSEKGKYKNDKKALKTKEQDPDALGYPYSVDKTPEPLETTAEHIEKERKAEPPPRTDDTGTGSKEYADNKEGQPVSSNRYNSDTRHKDYSDNKGAHVADNHASTAHDDYGDNKVNHDFVSEDYNPGHKEYEESRPVHSRKNYDSDSGHRDYSDSKPEHASDSGHKGYAEPSQAGTINGYSPFLNPFFNPFSIFGFQHKHPDDDQDHAHRLPDREQESPQRRPYRGREEHGYRRLPERERRPDREQENSQRGPDRGDQRPSEREQESSSQRENSERRPDREQEILQHESEKEQKNSRKQPDREHEEPNKPHEPPVIKQAEQVHVPGTKPFRIRGTRIQGGKITGGTITGGIIEGGNIEGGNIEGGLIKGGHVEGGKFKNGTMEGGVFHDGLMEGGHLINGSFEGGRMRGGNMYGGQVRGGSIYGGNIKGGILLGGLFHGGSLEGGVMKGGEVHGGSIKGGNMEGGLMTGGSVEGGVLKYGRLSGGTIKAGSMLGGEMTNGSIEGGTLKGGSITGGVLKGGVMEGGQLKGGVVLAGKIKGGIIEGGVIEGGEINDGVIIKSGRINGTILAMKTRDRDDKKESKEDAKEKGKHDGKKEGDGLNPREGSLTSVIWKEPKHVSHSSESTKPTPQLIVIDDINNMKTTARPIKANQTRFNSPNVNGTITVSRDSNSTMNETGMPDEKDATISISTMIHTGDSPDTTDSPPPTEIPGMVSAADLPSAELPAAEEIPAMTTAEESDFMSSPTIQPYVQLTGQNRDLTPAAKRGKHHIVIDGVSFDIPDGKLTDHEYLSQLVNHVEHELHEALHEDKQVTKNYDKNQTLAKNNNKQIKQGDQLVTKQPSEMKQEDVQSIDIAPVDQEQLMKSLGVKAIEFRPSYHWSLNSIMGDRIPGSPGAAMISHGHIRKTRGGIAFNGEDAWLGGGDFAGGCISAPDKCADGFSFEMTLKIDKDSLFKSDDMRYIVDSGASTFNSKGFSLYTLHGKLRADIAIPNDSICLESPLEADRWHDVLVTWRKDKGLKLYLNCELKGQAKSSDQCLGCRSPGCHVTDKNTQLMIGRPNYSPHFRCTKFESGDISFWEKYLNQEDVNMLCGRDTVSKLNKDAKPATTSRPTQPKVNKITPEIRQRYAAAYEANKNLLNGQQTYRQVNAPASYPAPYQASYPPAYLQNVGYLKPGTTYHFTQYIPAVGPSSLNPSRQMYSSYYPGQPRSKTARLHSSKPSYESGANSVKQESSGNLESSPVTHQSFSEWSDWSACSEPCGYGVRARSRSCRNPRVPLGGHVCRGALVQHGFCFVRACPVLGSLKRPSLDTPKSALHGSSALANLHHGKNQLNQAQQKATVQYGYGTRVNGGYGNWSPWGQCDRTCGRGAQVRTRLCNHPTPSIMGRSCAALGPSLQVQRCNDIPCPVDGGHSGWSAFSPCSKSCGPGGVQYRVRTCTNPRPAYGGKACVGPSQETRSCLNYVPCPVPPRYANWGQWSGCDADCGGGVRERVRQCIRRGATKGSCSSLGPSRMTEPCNLNPC
ncbi:Hemicentin-1 [Exaiptasia diaphana]|nr:Hemicentin-1 [Exaiptasia diaphana]